MRLLPDVMDALDRYCERQEPTLSRADGMRRFAIQALKGERLLS